MSLLIGFLTFLLVMNCLFLMLLVLIQLPKKEAGAGVAFGGGATDALFGAGSGNALTKMTKYSASFFVCMSLLLSLMNSSRARESNRRLEDELLKKANASAAVLPGLAATNLTAPSAPILQTTNALQSAVTTQTTARVLEAPQVSSPVTTNIAPAPAALQQTPAAPAPAAAPPGQPAANPAAAPAPKK